MTQIKWNNPLSGIGRQNQLLTFENFFGDFFNHEFTSKEFAAHVPAVNISENEKGYNIEVSAPGFEKTDFNLEIEEGVLTISGEHKTEKNESDKSFVSREFNYGSFSRKFNLVDLIDEEKIDAKYENGVLKLDLPKHEKTNEKHVKHIKIA